MAKLALHAQQLSQLEGLGDYPSGKELTQAFVNKALDEESGAVVLIRKMQEKLQEQADAFRAAAKDYRATDEAISDDMRQGMRQ